MGAGKVRRPADLWADTTRNEGGGVRGQVIFPKILLSVAYLSTSTRQQAFRNHISVYKVHFHIELSIFSTMITTMYLYALLL